MRELEINLEKTERLAEQITSLGTDLRDYSGRIEDASEGLKRNHAIFIDILCGKISVLNEELLKEAAKLDSLSEALNLIITRYTETEKQITGYNTGNPAGNNTGTNGSNNAESQNVFDKFISWLKGLFGWKEETLSEERQREKEHDLYMQKEIFDLLETEEYNKKTWKKASPEEREQILESFMQKLAEIFGVTVSSEIIFDSLGEDTRGMYSHGNRTVYINKDYLKKKDSYEIMQTMIHEMRHAYQHAAVDNPDSYNVSEETIKQWSENFKPENYKSTKNGYTFEEYVSQPVEYDAKNFAKQKSDLYNAKPEYNGSWKS